MESFSEDQVHSELKIERFSVDPYRRANVLSCDFLRQWFLQRGYTMYSVVHDEYSTGYHPAMPTSCADSDDHVCFPYACQGGDDAISSPENPPLSAFCWSRVIWAQDQQQRHVAIKIVNDASEEYAVLRFLHEQGHANTLENFNNVIPVLDMLPFGEFWFAVMPRWGTSFYKPHGPTMKDALYIVHTLLKGLAYLHKNRITHGDISTSNIVVNQFGRQACDLENPMRRTLRWQERLTYAFIDFEFSHIFPLSWSDKQCRLPYQLSWRGTPGYVPPDASAGELDYDPFAQDVASLGLVLSEIYDYLIPRIPMLAPLFDRMITRDIPRRFTAEQALRFFDDEVYPRTTPAQLSTMPGPRPVADVLRDRWNGLDPVFVKEWEAYREPPVPWKTKLMRRLCDYPFMLHTVIFIRRILRVIREAIQK